jgi:tRNA threonylcarbamoyladenosine biosynthesis protein TsaE
MRLWLVEWPDHGLRGLPAPDLELDLQVDGEGRRLRLEPRSAEGRAWVGALQEAGRLGPSS